MASLSVVDISVLGSSDVVGSEVVGGSVFCVALAGGRLPNPLPCGADLCVVPS